MPTCAVISDNKLHPGVCANRAHDVTTASAIILDNKCTPGMCANRAHDVDNSHESDIRQYSGELGHIICMLNDNNASEER